MAEWLFMAGLLAVALVLFWTRRTSPEITSLIVLVALILPWPHPGGEWASILSYQEGLAGFGSSAVVMVGSMFVLGGAIVRTGAADALAARLLRSCSDREWTLQLAVLGVSTLTSMLLNDTTVVLILLPILIAICREKALSPGRYLIFAAYGSLLGGQWTLIGTRSNILLSDYLRGQGQGGLGFFAFTPIAAVVLVAAAAWMLTGGRRVLPDATPSAGDEPAMPREYLTEARITPGSPMIGRSLDELSWTGREDRSVIEALRGGRPLPPWAPLAEGDELVLKGGVDAMGDVLRSDAVAVTKQDEMDEKTLQSVDLVLVEAFLGSGSRYLGRTLASIDFARSHGFTVVALARGGRRIEQRPMRTPLRLGDSVLLVGNSEAVPRLRADTDLVVLGEQPVAAFGRRKALLVAVLLAAVVALALVGALPPPVSLPTAALLAVLFGCIRSRDALESIDWSTLITVAGLLPFGTALEKTGGAQALARWVIDFASGASPQLALAAVLLLALAVTQVIDNAAVAIIMAPIGFRVAAELGVDARPFFIGLGICISSSFCTPFAHESSLLVSSAGRYHFRHFLQAGGVLALATWLLTTLLAPLVSPF